MRPASLAFVALATTVTLASGASPGPATKYASRVRTARVGIVSREMMRFGKSLGSPTEGHLIGGAHLTETEYLRIEPADTAGDVRWGLAPLVTMIDRAARAVRRQFPGTLTSVGHLSREGGGDVDRHRSHESGRDADVGFFIKSSSGRQLLSPHFVSFRSDGSAPSWPGAYFDDARNWTLVAALVGDAEAHVTHVFVAAPLRARLLAYAERIGAPAGLRMRAAELMQQPRGVLPHDDHFHVRIGCPVGMSGCVENPTLRTSRQPPPLMARGHRGERAAHALITSVPKRGSPVSASPSEVPADEPQEPAGDPASPPASLPLPVDDVDG